MKMVNCTRAEASELLAAASRTTQSHLSKELIRACMVYVRLDYVSSAAEINTALAEVAVLEQEGSLRLEHTIDRLRKSILYRAVIDEGKRLRRESRDSGLNDQTINFLQNARFYLAGKIAGRKDLLRELQSLDPDTEQHLETPDLNRGVTP